MFLSLNPVQKSNTVILVNDSVIKYLKSKKVKTYSLNDLGLRFSNSRFTHGEVVLVSCEKFVVEYNKETNQFGFIPYWPITELPLNMYHPDNDVSWFAQYGRNSQACYYPNLKRQRNKVIKNLSSKGYDISTFSDSTSVIEGLLYYPSLHKLHMRKLAKLDLIETV